MADVEVNSVQEAPARQEASDAADGDIQIQPIGFLLELSPDWLILRASENVHGFLGEYHVRLIGEPLSKFTMAQPLHDLRNTLSRLGGSHGIGRAYRVRLIDEPKYFDIAFQLSGGRILFEGVASPEDGVGRALGSVARLIDGPTPDQRRTVIEGAARRMRALTGFDRVTLSLKGEEPAESTRGSFAPSNRPRDAAELPALICNASAAPVSLFPRMPQDEAPKRALLRSPKPKQLAELREQEIHSTLTVPLIVGGETRGYFECDDRKPREPDLEMHAAAELFAQVVGLQLQMTEG